MNWDSHNKRQLHKSSTNDNSARSIPTNLACPECHTLFHAQTGLFMGAHKPIIFYCCHGHHHQFDGWTNEQRIFEIHIVTKLWCINIFYHLLYTKLLGLCKLAQSKWEITKTLVSKTSDPLLRYRPKRKWLKSIWNFNVSLRVGQETLIITLIMKKYFTVPGPLVSPTVAVCGWCKLTSDLDPHTF